MPPFQGSSCILVVIDKFSYDAHFYVLPSHSTVLGWLNLFLNMVCKHHKFPRSIVPDSDPIFIDQFLHKLFEPSATKLCMHISYNPMPIGKLRFSIEFWSNI